MLLNVPPSVRIVVLLILVVLLVILVIPAILLAFALGGLWILGLPCGKDRRDYVEVTTQRAMGTVATIFRGTLKSLPMAPESLSPGRRSV